MSTHPAPMMIEDFDAYESDEAIAKTWYKPGHGNFIGQSRETVIKAGGKYSLKIAYRTEPGEGKNYAAFCRVHYKWDMTGYNAMRFWFKPDGSGHHLDFQLNIHEQDGKNIHDLWEIRIENPVGDDSPRWITVPFAALEHNVRYADAPNYSPVFLPANCIEIAFYIGSEKGITGEGVVYFDDIQAVWVE